MKEVFTSKYLEISVVKGFVLGIGLSDSNNHFIIFVGPIVFDFTLPKKKVKSPYEVTL